MEEMRVIELAPQYSVTESGRIFSRLSQKFLSPGVKPGGYEYVGLGGNGGKCRYHIVHRLVAHAFVPNPNGCPEVNHKDGNKRNNDYRNLEWVTRKQNAKHAVENDLVAFWKTIKSSKLNETQVREIRAHIEEGKLTYKQIGKKYGICLQGVCSIKKGRIYARVV